MLEVDLWAIRVRKAISWTPNEVVKYWKLHELMVVSFRKSLIHPIPYSSIKDCSEGKSQSHRVDDELSLDAVENLPLEDLINKSCYRKCICNVGQMEAKLSIL